jgi:hypothetical protein
VTALPNISIFWGLQGKALKESYSRARMGAIQIVKAFDNVYGFW